MAAEAAILDAALRAMPVVPMAAQLAAQLRLEDFALAISTYRPHLRLARAHRAYTVGKVRTVIATNDQGKALAELNEEGEEF